MVKKVFDSPLSGREAAWKLLQLCQDSRSVEDYAVDVCALAAESAWNTEFLFVIFLKLLSEEDKDEHAARELPTDLNWLIALTIDRWVATETGGRGGLIPVPIACQRIPPCLRGTPEVASVYVPERIRVPPRVSEVCRLSFFGANATRQH